MALLLQVDSRSDPIEIATREGSENLDLVAIWCYPIA